MKSAGPCGACGAEIWIPDALYEAARHSPEVHFYCSYGHGLHFAKLVKQEPPPQPKVEGNIVTLVKKE